MKTRLFVIQYANYRIGQLEKQAAKEGWTDELKEAANRISRAVHYAEEGMITIDEAMQTICNAGKENAGRESY